MDTSSIPAASFEVFNDEDVIIRVTVKDQNGAVKDLTGATVDFRIGDIRSGIFLFQKAGAITNPPGTDGVIQVTLTSAETALWAVRSYDFQFLVTDSGGNDQVVIDGLMDVKVTLLASAP